MAAKPAFATLGRVASYFRGIKVVDNHVCVRRTGAKIKIDRSFLRSFFSAAEIYSYIVALRIWRVVRGARPTHTIAFHPQAAAPWYNIWSVAQLAGLKTIADLRSADTVFVFDDNTYTNAGERLPLDIDAVTVNSRCANISKQFVADVFENVFGYALAVDPTIFEGRAVRKSQHNGAHDGEVVECPIPPSEVMPGFAYQKLIETSRDGGRRTEDLRVAYVFGELAAVFHKYKATEKRFGTEYLQVKLLNDEAAFSPQEIEKIIEYCEAVGLDFGALDVLRDVNDGRIYIVDVNKTCMPVLSLTFGKQIKAYRRIADAFLRGTWKRQLEVAADTAQ